MKRGQMSLFAVLGIVIVTVIVVGIFFRGQISEKITEFEIVKSEAVKEMEAQIKSHSQDCLKKVTIDGAKEILASGGYYNNAPLSLVYRTYQVPYYNYEHKEQIPTLEEIEENLATYIERNINVCISKFPQSLEIGSAEVEVIFGAQIKAKVKHSLTMQLPEGRVRVKKYDVKVNADIESIYENVLEFYDEVKNISELDIASPGVLALESEYEFSMPDLEDENFIFILYYNKSIEQKDDIDYTFAIKPPKFGDPTEELLASFDEMAFSDEEGFSDEDFEVEPLLEGEFTEALEGTEEEEDEEPFELDEDFDSEDLTEEELADILEGMEAMDELGIENPDEEVIEEPPAE